MYKAALIAAGALIIAVPAQAKKGPKLADSIATLKGKPFRSAVDALGLPTGKMDMPGSTIYSWEKGNVYTGYGDNEQPLSCTIRLEVLQDGLIKGGDFDGNRGACQLFEKQFTKPAS